jgi:hypothetical protein
MSGKTIKRLDLEEIILNHCTEKKGFLAKLRIDKVFDEEAYQALLVAIKDYHKLLNGSSVIDRKIAGCLNFLVYTLLLEIITFPKNGRDKALVQNAHAKFWEIVQNIFELQ